MDGGAGGEGAGGVADRASIDWMQKIKGASKRARKAFLGSIPSFSDSGDLRLPGRSFTIRSSARSEPPEILLEDQGQGN